MMRLKKENSITKKDSKEKKIAIKRMGFKFEKKKKEDESFWIEGLN
jgi:hypothetical protein